MLIYDVSGRVIQEVFCYFNNISVNLKLSYNLKDIIHSMLLEILFLARKKN
jgi:hypothetical protein